MNTYVVIRDMTEGNAEVGEMWQETKIYSGDTTLEEVMKWAMQPYSNGKYSHKRITITKPHEDNS